jgi:hypothetical protein
MRSLRCSTTRSPPKCPCPFASQKYPLPWLHFGHSCPWQLHLNLRYKPTLLSPNRNGVVVLESTDFRTRRNQVVMIGNNKFGKGGKPRCDRCRRRRRKVYIPQRLRFTDCKCKYASIDATCDSCRSDEIIEPCVKKWGPRKEATSIVSQPLSLLEPETANSTASLPKSLSPYLYHAVVDSPCHFVLRRIFSQRLFRFAASFDIWHLLHKLPSLYGPFIAHPALQDAFCALGMMLTGMYEAKLLLEYRGRALSSLMRRLAEPVQVDEGDAFTAALLAISSPPDSCEFTDHFGGLVSLMKHLRSQSPEKCSLLSFFWLSVKNILLNLVIVRRALYRPKQLLRAPLPGLDPLFAEFRPMIDWDKLPIKFRHNHLQKGPRPAWRWDNPEGKYTKFLVSLFMQEMILCSGRRAKAQMDQMDDLLSRMKTEFSVISEQLLDFSLESFLSAIEIEESAGTLDVDSPNW